ncbi:Asp-tRNA(Asn)/Glu-tRNA(Gln) amidotransferase GatCAB subunit A, partial [Candidatus Peregrinibacteria bacterium CG11_big_fil_rev_8_21_14_0_20_46_8]
RISRFGVISMASSLDTIGPITRDVEDAAHLLQLLAGHDLYDSTTPDVPVPDYVAAMKGEDGASSAGGANSTGAAPSLKGIKLGIPKEFFSAEGMDEDQANSVRTAIEELKKLGAEIVDISLPHSMYGLAVYYIICPSEVSANMARYDGIRYGHATKDADNLLDYYMKTRSEGFGDEMKRRIMIGTYALSAGYYDAFYLKAQKVRTIIKREFEEAFQKVDAMIAPTVPTPAFKVGENVDDPVAMYLQDILTCSINIVGVPSISVPCGLSKPAAGAVAGLPLGMQIIGPQFGEEKILRVGYAYQQVTDWHKKRAAL